jgi:hypothetical protein
MKSLKQFFYPYINSSILGSVKQPPILYFMSKYERKLYIYKCPLFFYPHVYIIMAQETHSFDCTWRVKP